MVEVVAEVVVGVDEMMVIQILILDINIASAGRDGRCGGAGSEAPT